MILCSLLNDKLRNTSSRYRQSHRLIWALKKSKR